MSWSPPSQTASRRSGRRDGRCRGSATRSTAAATRAPTAVRGLQIGNDSIEFSARFGGSSRHVELPPRAVLGVYARENNKGMLFPEEPSDGPEGGGSDSKAGGPKRPSLKVVK